MGLNVLILPGTQLKVTESCETITTVRSEGASGAPRIKKKKRKGGNMMLILNVVLTINSGFDA